MMPQRTAEIPLVIPTPMIALLEVCVVLTGKPMFEANSMTLAAARFAANPLGGERPFRLVLSGSACDSIL